MPPEMVSKSLQALQGPGQPRGQLRELKAARRKDGKRNSNSGCRSKTIRPTDSTGLLKNKSSVSGEAELSAQAGESLRWEEALEDPQAEEMRLKLYRANRRQRYMAYRKALLKDNQAAFSEEKKAFAESEKQVAASLLHLKLK